MIILEWDINILSCGVAYKNNKTNLKVQIEVLLVIIILVSFSIPHKLKAFSFLLWSLLVQKCALQQPAPMLWVTYSFPVLLVVQWRTSCFPSVDVEMYICGCCLRPCFRHYSFMESLSQSSPVNKCKS